MDYWSKLKLNECWSERERYNILMSFIDEKINGASSDNATSNVNTVNAVTTGEVIVSVIDEDSNGVGNVNVSLTNTDNEYSTRTGSKGGCTIKNVEFGEYTVTATCDGYAPYNDTITISEEEFILNIVLVKIVSFDGEDEAIDDDSQNSPNVSGGQMFEEDGEF